MRKLNSVKEAADLLGVSASSVYAAVQAGKMEIVKFGGRILVPEKTLRDLMEGRWDDNEG